MLRILLVCVLVAATAYFAIRLVREVQKADIDWRGVGVSAGIPARRPLPQLPHRDRWVDRGLIGQKRGFLVAARFLPILTRQVEASGVKGDRRSV